MRVRDWGARIIHSYSMPFYRDKPAMRPATARRLIELPDIKCEAPLEAPDEVAGAPPEVVEAAGPALAADSVATPLAETGPVASAFPVTMEPEGFWPGAGAVALVAIAACWNASKLFAAVGLIANTIPI